jgi:23S rRNA A2030 N6-methylase RlmJ
MPCRPTSRSAVGSDAGRRGRRNIRARPRSRAHCSAPRTLDLWDRDAVTHEKLARRFEGAASARAICADGLVALADAVRAAERRADDVVVLVDPPWAQKADWTGVPDSLARAVAASRRASFILWYPVKSLTRRTR